MPFQIGDDLEDFTQKGGGRGPGGTQFPGPGGGAGAYYGAGFMGVNPNIGPQNTPFGVRRRLTGRSVPPPGSNQQGFSVGGTARTAQPTFQMPANFPGPGATPTVDENSGGGGNLWNNWDNPFDYDPNKWNSRHLMTQIARRALDSGTLDPRGNPVIMAELERKALRDANALRDRSALEADLLGLDPASRAFATKQAYSNTDRGMQDILSSARYDLMSRNDERNWQLLQDLLSEGTQRVGRYDAKRSGGGGGSGWGQFAGSAVGSLAGALFGG